LRREGRRRDLIKKGRVSRGKKGGERKRTKEQEGKGNRGRDGAEGKGGEAPFRGKKKGGLTSAPENGGPRNIKVSRTRGLRMTQEGGSFFRVVEEKRERRKGALK